MSITQPGTDSGAQSSRGSVSAYEVVQASAEFRTLRRRFGSFAVPALVLVLTWYFLYVTAAAFAPGFMGIKVFGDVNAGMCFGLGQFAVTFAVTVLASRWMRGRVDPLSEELRERLEKGRRQ